MFPNSCIEKFQQTACANLGRDDVHTKAGSGASEEDLYREYAVFVANSTYGNQKPFVQSSRFQKPVVMETRYAKCPYNLND